MKKFFAFFILFLFFIIAQGQRNFYTVLDSLYKNDTNLLLPDSLKSGSVKNIDRMNEIWSQRLSPHGEVSVAAEKMISYSQSFENQVNNKSESIGGTEMPIFTNGVYRSLDYGQNWEPINNGLLSHFTNGGTIRNIVIDSTDANILYIATTEGVFKTSNALSTTPTWTKLTVSSTPGISEDFKGLEQHPTTAATVYAASNDIFKTTNGGSSWSSMTGSGTGLVIDSIPFDFIVKRINLAVTPAAPNRLYAYISGSDTSSFNVEQNGQMVSVTGIRHPSIYIFMYKDSSWQQLHRLDLGEQKIIAPSWMGLAVSPLDPEMVFFSSAIVYGSNDITSQNFNTKSSYNGNGYHADTHELEFEPNTASNPKLFSANHGGVSMKNVQSPGISRWSFKNDGLNVSLIWSFDISKVNSDIRIIGRQDNGAHKKENGNWTYLGAGDGYGAQIYNDNISHRFTYHSGVVHYGTNLDLPFNAIKTAIGVVGNGSYPNKMVCI